MTISLYLPNLWIIHENYASKHLFHVWSSWPHLLVLNQLVLDRPGPISLHKKKKKKKNSWHCPISLEIEFHKQYWFTMQIPWTLLSKFWFIRLRGSSGTGVSANFSAVSDFPGGASGNESPANARDAREVGSIRGSGRSSGKGKWQPTPVFLPENFHRQEEPGELQRVRHDWATEHTHVSQNCLWITLRNSAFRILLFSVRSISLQILLAYLC